MKKILKSLVLSAAGLGLFGAAPASAVEFTCSTAKLIVPWKPGGGTAVIFNIFEKIINESGAKPRIQVVTVPGQGGNKGAKEAAKSKPDGCIWFYVPAPRRAAGR